MMRTSKRALLELIEDLTNENKPYQEKRDDLLSLTTENERVALLEFASWFEGDHWK